MVGEDGDAGGEEGCASAKVGEDDFDEGVETFFGSYY